MIIDVIWYRPHRGGTWCGVHFYLPRYCPEWGKWWCIL